MSFGRSTYEVTTRRIVLLLLAVSLILGFTTGGSVFIRIGYIWGILFIMSMLWVSNASRGLSLRRTIRASRAQVGQIFEEQYDILNSSRFPLFWVQLRDESPLPGTQGEYVLNLIRGKNLRSFLLRSRLYQRGVYHMGPISLAFGDIFGLYRGSRTIPVRSTLLVYPPIFPISSFPIFPGVLPGGEALRKQTHQITPNAAGIREYFPGDPLNRIHWLSTVRRDRLMVKEFELDPLADVWIFIDSESCAHTSAPIEKNQEDKENFWDWLPLLELPAFTEPVISSEMHGRAMKIGLPPSTEEYGVSISASLARYFLQLGRAVGLASLGHSLTLLPPDRSGRQLGKILEALALLKADGNIPFSSWVDSEARHLTRGSIVILISPAERQDIVFLADGLNHMGLRPVVILIDGPSFINHGVSTITEEIYMKVRHLGLPAFRILRGDNLTAILSAGMGLPIDKTQSAVGLM